MHELVLSILSAMRVFFQDRADVALEVLALRQQLAVLKRKRPRPPLNVLDRTVFTIPWERTRRIEGLWRRSQQRMQSSIPCSPGRVAPSLLLACGGVIVNSS